MTDSAQNIIMGTALAALALVVFVASSIESINRRKQGPWIYYWQALKAIQEKRWLIMVPLLVFTVQFIFFHLPLEAQYLSTMDPALEKTLSQRNLFVPAWSTPFFWSRLFSELPGSPATLDMAYLGVFILNKSMLVLTLLGALFLTVRPTAMAVVLREEDRGLGIFPQWALKISGATAVLGGIVLWFLLHSKMSGAQSWMASNLETDLIPYCNTALASLCEAAFLFASKEWLMNREINTYGLLRQLLMIFRPLLQLNLIVLTLTKLLGLGWGMASAHHTSLADSPWSYLQVLMVLGYLRYWIVPATLLMPLIITVNGGSLREAWARNWRFIRSYPTDYCFFIFTGSALWFLSHTLLHLKRLSMNPLFVLSHDLGLLFVFFQLLLLTFFYVALFIWFLDEYGRDVKHPSNRNQTETKDFGGDSVIY